MADSKGASGALPPLPMPPQRRERRRAKRHPAKLAAYLAAADDEDQHLGLVANISATGALLVTRAVFELGDGVRMTLYLPQGGERSATGEIVRSDKIFDDRAELWPYEVAIEFDAETEFAGELADWTAQQVKLGVIKP